VIEDAVQAIIVISIEPTLSADGRRMAVQRAEAQNCLMGGVREGCRDQR
jgi:hypothetical protein